MIDHRLPRTRIIAICALLALVAACDSDSDSESSAPAPAEQAQTEEAQSEEAQPQQAAASGEDTATHSMAAAPATPAGATIVPLLDGLGTHTHKISTQVPEAQAYFDQGIRLLFNFNHAEAIRTFEEATRRDAGCAICYWGVAFAHGPNINMPMMPEAVAPAYAAAMKAQELASSSSPAERAYIGAIVKRYSNDPAADRAALDKAFADAMREVAKTHPDDLDAQVFFAESLMDTSPWNYWQADRTTPNPGLEELNPTLEAVLAKVPAHVGANHLYIHANEATRNPGRAEAAADNLRGSMPAAGHLVHMPSHIYNRIGRYDDVVDDNMKAQAADEGYFEKTGQKTGIYAAMYYVHNIHFVWMGAAETGQSALALEHARKVVANVDPAMAVQMPPLEPFVSVPQLTLLRFGQWDGVLAEPALPADLALATALYRYARTRAYIAKGDMASAATEQTELVALKDAPAFEKHKSFGVPAKEIVDIATTIVAGDMARKNGDLEGAITQYREAVALQDALSYMEPPYWDYPIRQQLGAALLEAGQAPTAEQVFREDLAEWPGNGWSLFGLMQSLEAQGKADEAAAAKAELDAAWKRADVQLAAAHTF